MFNIRILWGKPMWGTWWVWDARLTSVAILFIIYLIIIFLNKTFENRDVREKTIAIFILIGSINLPIIKFSVDWWNTLHQPASISKLIITIYRYINASTSFSHDYSF